MTAIRAPHAVGLAAATASGIGFSISTVVGQAAITHGMSSIDVVGIRLWTGAAMLFGLAAALGWSALRGRTRLTLAVTGTLTAVQASLLFASIDRIGSSLAILLLYLYAPLVAVIAAATGRERITRRKLFAIAVAVGGLTLVIGSPGDDVNTVGVLFGIGSGIALAVYISVADRVTVGVPPLAATAWIQFGAAVSLVPVVALVARTDNGPREFHWWVVFIGAASGAAACLFIVAIKHVTPTIASITSTVEPIATAALAMAFLGDSLGMVQLCGGVLIVLAVVAVSRPESTDALPDARPAPEGAARSDSGPP
jgi:drug/metabolite transporter (DMT)-like permease